MSRTRGSGEKGQILVLAALLLSFLFIPLSVFVIDTGLVEAGYAQLSETVQAAAEDGASMLNADLYRSSHGRSVELDPALARPVPVRALADIRLPGLDFRQKEVK